MNGFIFDYTSYIGIPYLKGGSSFNECDCWGLVRLVYLNEMGVTLPVYTDFEDTEPFTSVIIPKVLDIALIANNTKGVINHCALIIATNMILHSLETTGTVVSRLSLWQNKIRRYYTLRSGYDN